MGFVDIFGGGSPNPNSGQTLNSYMGKVASANNGVQSNHQMNGWDDMMNQVGGFFGGIGNALGSFGQKLDSGMSDPHNAEMLSPSDPYSNYGTSDISQSSAPASNNTPTPSPASNPSSDPNSGGASGGDMGGQAGLSQTLIDAFLHQAAAPAMDPALINNTMAMIAGMNNGNLAKYAPVNYLQQARDAYGKELNTVAGIQSGVDNRYGQVGTDMADMYKANVNASRMGNNNILQQIASNEGNAVQAGARNNVAALTQLKNAELAQRAAVAQQGGMPQAQGDYMKTNPADVAVATTLGNAQQQAANAQAGARDQANLNNEMGMALANQGNIMHSQLMNNQTAYDASMGKYKADLANQETTREMEAQKQMYADAMAKVQAGYGIAKDQAALNIQKNQALWGNKGFLGDSLPSIGAYNLDNSKAMAQQAQAGNVDPASTALHAFPQLATAYNNALKNTLALTPGTKPTADDVYKAMANDPSISGVPGNDLINFSQMVTANKAMNSPYDEMMLALQGQ